MNLNTESTAYPPILNTGVLSHVPPLNYPTAMTNQELWKAVLGELELLVSKANFTTWFRSTAISSINEGSVTVSVPNAFTKAWLENKYHGYIITALQRLTNQQVSSVQYLVSASTQGPAPALTTSSPSQATADQNQSLGTPVSERSSYNPPQILNKGGLNPRYTFDRFIVGKSTELAYAACKAVAEKPGSAYNPLFLYGGVGLGKTHLIQAIGNEVLKNFPDIKVLFTSCEQFTNNFVQSIREGRGDQFKKEYREVDLLLVDDIQFLANKEQTQEEFFHTFNALHQAGRQIILTSDRPPKSISIIEARLVSRFEWGMTADVGKPDLETRVAIVQRQAEDRSFPLPPDVVSYVAETVTNNVRELEGALTKLAAYYQLNRVVPNVEVARGLISSLQGEGLVGGGLTPRRVINAVAKHYDVTVENLLGASRRRELVVPRQVAMYLLREDCGSSFPTIGHELGGRDHTTAMHACSKVKREVESGGKVRADVEQVRLLLNGG